MKLSNCLDIKLNEYELSGERCLRGKKRKELEREEMPANTDDFKEILFNALYSHYLVCF